MRKMRAESRNAVIWGKTSFKYAAASDWNLLQKQMKLQNLVSYNYFKSLLCNLESNLTVCNCS